MPSQAQKDATKRWREKKQRRIRCKTKGLFERIHERIHENKI